mmetsp:Transcript_43532/g.102279  ORF Transcript_43532/g.102279 Transcript_43532/m.102279 type:complete len:391 (+) Transcript_43532:801-1973(+)
MTVVGMLDVVITVPETSGKEMMLLLVGGVISNVVLPAHSSPSSASENTSGNRPVITALISTRPGRSAVPSITVGPTRDTFPSSCADPSTCSCSTMSGKFPVVITVPVTSGSVMTLCPLGSSIASDSVRRSCAAPSSCNGRPPPITACTSNELLFPPPSPSPCPSTTLAPSSAAPPRNSASPAKLALCSTSGRFPVVSTVPLTSGSTSSLSAVGSSIPRESVGLAGEEPEKESGNADAIAEFRLRLEGLSASPMVTSPSMTTGPRICAAPVTTSCSITVGSEPEVTMVPEASGKWRRLSKVGSGTWRVRTELEPPDSEKASGKRPSSCEFTCSCASPPGSPICVLPATSTSPLTPSELSAPASLVMSRRLPVVKSTPDVSGSISSCERSRR